MANEKDIRIKATPQQIVKAVVKEGAARREPKKNT